MKKGDPYDELASVYSRVLGQWVLELNHVSALVGGFDSQQKNIGQEGVRFTPVSRDKQAKAVQFLNANAFQTPLMFVRPEILRRIEPSGELDRIKQAQMRVLSSLLDTRRLSRLVEQEALDGVKAYKPTELLADVRKGVWKELDSSKIKIDAYRRNLQRGYLELISQRLNGRVAQTDDERPLLRGELKSLRAQIGQNLSKAGDRQTKLHLEDARDQIAKMLDPRFQPASPSGPQIFGRAAIDEESCWPDYAIK
jgi:hypothetical protein